MACGLAGLSKPIWLSLICRKVKPLQRLGGLGLAEQAERLRHAAGTVHNTPVPAQIMHSSACRRLMPSPSLS